MSKRDIKGIALILFGILLCLAGSEVNHIIFHSLSYLPFGFIGLVTGAVGMYMIFSKSGK